MLSSNNSSRARDFPSTGEESFLPVVSILSKKLISSEIFSFVSSQILRKRYSQMLAIFLSQVGIFFLFAFPIWLKTNKKFPTLEISFLCLTQDKKMPTFEINICVKFDMRRKKKSRKFFPLSRVKFYANVILKCRQFLFISSRKFFPSSQVNFYANVILKCWQFFLSRVGNYFLRLESNFTQTLFWNVGNFFYLKLEFFSLSLVKFYANIILKHRPFFYLESEIFSFVLTWDEGKHFRLEIKKICRYLRITFA